MFGSLPLLFPKLKLSFPLLVMVNLCSLLVLLRTRTHTQVELPYIAGNHPLNLCPYHPLQKEVQFFLLLVIFCFL